MRLSATKLGSIANSRSFGDQLFDLAGEVPNLDLNFAGTKTLDPRVTFTRASTGTYVGADGLVKTATTNEARFDHNPTTGESLGLLVEEARTNLAIYSEQFNDASWTKTDCTITANTVVSPDGLTTGDSITSSAGLLGRVVQTINQTTGMAYTFSTFAKANQYTFCQLRITGTVVGAVTRAYFNLTTGAITGAANCIASITPVGNGWYRCSITYTTILTATASPRVYGQVDAADTVGDGTSGIYIWGAQMEAGAFPTSYIPTTTATVTRAADVASVTGANFSSWYNQTEGTVFAEYRTPASGTRGIAGFNDNTANERIELFTSGTDPKMLVVDGGTTQADLDGGIIVASIMTKTAGAYAVNDFSIVHAAGTAVTDTNGTLPTVNRLLIGADQAGNYQNGRTKRLTYWPVRLANPTLQSITTP